MGQQERMLTWFAYQHLPQPLKSVSMQFHNLAMNVVEDLISEYEEQAAT